MTTGHKELADGLLDADDYHMGWRGVAVGRAHRNAIATALDTALAEGKRAGVDALQALREALAEAEYQPGDHPVVPVRVAAFMDKARSILALTPSSPGSGVKVKGLEWLKPLGADTMTKAESLIGTYRVWTYHEANGRWFAQLRDRGGYICWNYEADNQASCISAVETDYEQRIMSALVTVPGSGWRDIKDAPRDGTRFLAWEPRTTPTVYECWWEFGRHAEGYWMNDLGNAPMPECWQPLPSPPALKGTEE